MQRLRNEFDTILRECKLVAGELEGMDTSLPRLRKKKSLEPDQSISDLTHEEVEFKINTYLVSIDSVIGGITDRFKAIKNINDTFSFFKFETMSVEEFTSVTKRFIKKYKNDVPDKLTDEIIHLKYVYSANFKPNLTPINLLNSIKQLQIKNLFPNVCVALRIFCTLPVTIASGQMSFSTLSRIKNHLKSCSGQNRTTNLDFDKIISDFAFKKACKANL